MRYAQLTSAQTAVFERHVPYASPLLTNERRPRPGHKTNTKDLDEQAPESGAMRPFLRVSAGEVGLSKKS